jgi:hypothetical protein
LKNIFSPFFPLEFSNINFENYSQSQKVVNLLIKQCLNYFLPKFLESETRSSSSFSEFQTIANQKYTKIIQKIKLNIQEKSDDIFLIISKNNPDILIIDFCNEFKT